jgi:hypothetical protein
MIENLKDLEKLFKLCRKHGIQEIDLSRTQFKLGDLPKDETELQEVTESVEPYGNFPQGELTPEQLIFYSSGGMPEDDPALKVS